MEPPLYHSTLHTVRGYELDSFGHVNNAVYLNYFEHGRWVLFRDLDLARLIQTETLFLVVTDIHIRYMREARLYDEIEIRTRVSLEDPYLIFNQKLIHQGTGLPLARGETKTIFINSDRRPVDIPAEFRKRM